MFTDHGRDRWFQDALQYYIAWLGIGAVDLDKPVVIIRGSPESSAE